uniref:Leukocyte cell-derived chemotaxin 1 n=1 Tax=Salarias fasciatus TaxID=181472 RepID=A0A672HY94_SALFA
MSGSSEKVPIASAGPEDLHQFLPPVTRRHRPAPEGRVAVLLAGALLLLLGAVGAFYFWNNNEKHVYNVHYSMSINGKVEEGSMEIDTANNMERFSTGSRRRRGRGGPHDFEIGITGIRFSGGEKCYIKTKVKARLPDVEALNKDSLTFDLVGCDLVCFEFESIPSVFRLGSFPRSKIKDLCGDRPIFWLRPTYSASKPSAAARRRRQAPAAGEEEEDVEAEFNPENPYQVRREQNAMTHDPMLDHQGRICEPLGGYHPYPYPSGAAGWACRVIMPCNWWVARILGLV